MGRRAEVGLGVWRGQHRVQARGRVREVGFGRDFQAQWRDAVAWLAQAPEDRWLFALKDVARDCVDPARLIALKRSSRRDWVLVPGTAHVPGCVPRAADPNPKIRMDQP